jgi:hypothetical protein
MRWCEWQSADLELTKENALVAYYDVKQKESQSIREFASFLSTVEERLEEQPGDAGRKKTLFAKALPALRREIGKYPDESTTYDSYVSFVTGIEERMPFRRKTIQDAKRSKGPRLGGMQTNRGSYLERRDKRRSPYARYADQGLKRDAGGRFR